MDRMEKLCDKDVCAAILYLDEDFGRALRAHRRRKLLLILSRKRWLKPGIVLVSVALLVYIAALRFLPSILRLLN